MFEAQFSSQYYYAVSELEKDRLEKRITEREYHQRRDELNEEEVKRQEHLGPVFIKQALEDVEKTISENQRKAFEAKMQREKLAQDQQNRKAQNEQKAKERREQEEQIKQEIEQERKEQERISFREMTEKNISERDASAKRLQRQYNILQIILLVFSTITATLAGIDGVARGFVAATGVMATLAGGLLTTFKLQDRIYANHKAVSELRLECQKYDYHIDDYKDISPEKAFIKFSRAVNLVQGEQMLQEVELWNPKKDERKNAQVERKADEQEKEEVEETRHAAEPLEVHEPKELFREDAEKGKEQLTEQQ